MKVKSIKLASFRNYEEETVNLQDHVNVFFGDNAQGKTNLLEAIHLFSTGKSHRGATDKELIRKTKEYGSLILEFETNEREIQEELRFCEGKRREMKCNGVKVTKKKDWIGNFKSVLFYPEELNLIKEGPENRRKFFDGAIGMLRPMYDYYLGVYQNVLRQKSRLLRKIEENPSYRKTLPTWNESLMELGSRIIFYRQSFVHRMQPLATDILKDITKGKEHLSIQYESPFANLKTIEAIKEKFKEKQNELFETEIAAKQALLGPHRDDFLFLLNGEAAKLYASQGQQRSIVLSMKLAQTEMIQKETGEYPVLLLDDIFSELDQKRRAFLTENIKEKQVLITCTDQEYVNFESNVAYFRVEEGSVKRCTSI